MCCFSRFSIGKKTRSSSLIANLTHIKKDLHREDAISSPASFALFKNNQRARNPKGSPSIIEQIQTPDKIYYAKTLNDTRTKQTKRRRRMCARDYLIEYTDRCLFLFCLYSCENKNGYNHQECAES